MKKKLYIYIPISASLLSFIIWQPQAFSASKSARVFQEVLADVSLKSTSNLRFETIESENFYEKATNTKNSNILITGAPGSTLNITVPSGSVFMTNSVSGNKVKVENFQLSSKNTKSLQKSGILEVSVGAVRGALNDKTDAGKYTGSFIVNVVY